MTERERDEDATTPEPTPVPPAPATASPSSTGVVAGDGDEPTEVPRVALTKGVPDSAPFTNREGDGNG